jgi:hypothetical protein
LGLFFCLANALVLRQNFATLNHTEPAWHHKVLAAKTLIIVLMVIPVPPGAEVGSTARSRLLNPRSHVTTVTIALLAVPTQIRAADL